MKILLGISLVIAAVAFAPTAAASPDVTDFVAAVHADGMSGTPAAIVADGLAVCDSLGRHDGLTVARALAQSEGISLDHAERFVIDAAHYLCPQWEPGGSGRLTT